MNVLDVVNDKSHLHLLLWDRFDNESQRKGLTLMCDLLRDHSTSSMLFLRPIGHKRDVYERRKAAVVANEKRYGEDHFEYCSSRGIPSPPSVDEDHDGYCELWVQLSDGANRAVRDWVENAIPHDDWAFGFYEQFNALWRPFGESRTDNDYCKRVPQDLQCLSDGELAALLKLTWHRASVAITEWIESHNRGLFWIPFEPMSQFKHALFKLMNKTFEEIDPEEYGLPSRDRIQPWLIDAAHMAAYAMNAITPVLSRNEDRLYRYEGYLHCQWLSHPYLFASKEMWLNLFLE